DTNTYPGRISIGLGGGATMISSDAGTLNLTSGIAIGGFGAGSNLILTGAGNGSISSSIATGNSSVTKSGSGTWTLTSASSTYSGGTTVNAGVLQLSGSGNLGSTSGSLSVNGGTLDLNGTNQSV